MADYKAQGVVNPKGEDMMTILGIAPERCEELCKAIEDTANENPGLRVGEIIDLAAKQHCRNINEEKFMFYIFGTHRGMAQSEFLNLIRQGGLFSAMMHHN
jgi:hypothetical protein